MVQQRGDEGLEGDGNKCEQACDHDHPDHGKTHPETHSNTLKTHPPLLLKTLPKLTQLTQKSLKTHHLFLR